MQTLERAVLRAGRRTQRGAADSREASDAEGEAAPSEELKVVVSIDGRKGHHRGSAALVGPLHRDL